MILLVGEQQNFSEENEESLGLGSNSFLTKLHFFGKIRGWILKSKTFIPGSLGSWCVKGTDESSLSKDSSLSVKKSGQKL